VEPTNGEKRQLMWIEGNRREYEGRREEAPGVEEAIDEVGQNQKL
jgi:hypothetical protein